MEWLAPFPPPSQSQQALFDLAAWVRFGTLTLFEVHLLLLYVLVLPNSSKLVAAILLGPMKSLWVYIEVKEWWAVSSS